MRLATLADGTRDGRLVVVSADLARCVVVPVRTLQAALDDWDAAAPGLAAAAARAETEGEPFDPAAALAPLPRAYAWIDGSAYLSHVERVRAARGAVMPPEFRTDPLMYQGGSDSLLGPRAPIRLADEAWGIDFEGEVAVITGDVAMGAGPDEAAAAIRLVTLVNDVSLRALIPAELAKGFGFFVSKPSSVFGPVAATPAALGAAWDGRRLYARLAVALNGRPYAAPHTARDMAFDFGQLIAHAAQTRPLAAGTIIGSGTISNADASLGGTCLQEARVIETVAAGAPVTPFLRFGDRVRIAAVLDDGSEPFGALDNIVERYVR